MALEQYKPLGDGVAALLDYVMVNELRLAMPHQYYLHADRSGNVWLIARMDTTALGKNISAYTHKRVTTHLSAALNKMPVIVSQRAGLDYGVLLSKRPSFPKVVAYPGWRKGIVQLGIQASGRAWSMRWPELGHVLVAGMTRFGKSNLLRLLLIQARQEGIKLLLADDGRTFGKFAGDAALMAPLVTTLDGCYQAVEMAHREIIRRARLFDKMPGRPDTLDEYNAGADAPLPIVLVMLDEFSSMVSSMGGSKSRFAETVTQIAWRGLKFGVQLVLSGQDFTKDTVGPVAEQMLTRICLRVTKHSVSRVVLNRGGAEHLRAPGRALTNRSVGKVQLYMVDQSELIPNVISTSGMSFDEEQLAAYLLSHYDGRVDLTAIMAHNAIGERQARRLRDDWVARGLAEKRPDRNNAIVLSVDENELKNVQASKVSKPAQTASKRPNERPIPVQTASEPRPSVQTI